MELNIQNSQSPEKLFSTRKIIGKGLHIGISTAIGLTVTYPLTLKKGNPILVIFSNTAFMFSYGLVNSCACYESEAGKLMMVSSEIKLNIRF